MKTMDIAKIIKGIPGFSNPDYLRDMFEVAEDTFHLQGDFVEIGTWCGRSAIPLGYVARELRCKLHCFDVFPKMDYWLEAKKTYPNIPIPEIKRVYELGGPEFLFNHFIQQHELRDTIVVHPHAFRNLGHNYRFAFIDGNHSYQSVRTDMALIANDLINEGQLVLDDATIRYPGVRKAFDESTDYIRKRKLNLKMVTAERKR